MMINKVLGLEKLNIWSLPKIMSLQNITKLLYEIIIFRVDDPNFHDNLAISKPFHTHTHYHGNCSRLEI